MKGGTEPFARFNLGDPAKPRNNVDLAFLTPDGKNIDARTLKPSASPCWVRDVVSSEKNQAGDGKEIVEKTIELMGGISKLYPAKRADPTVPWQASLGHAIFVSAWDTKNSKTPHRIVVVPSPVDPALEKLLADPELLKRHVFVKLEPKDAPAELADGMKRAGPTGLVLLDPAQSVDGFGREQSGKARAYPKVLEAKPGPHTKATVRALFGRP